MQSVPKAEKVCQSARKYTKVSKIVLKYTKVCESARKYAFCEVLSKHANRY